MNGDTMSIYIFLGLFVIGSVTGYIIEFLYRSLNSKTFVNPGFFKGPYLPIYGIGLIILNIIPIIIFNNNIIILSFISTFFLTSLEYISGVIFIKKLNIPLWDYSERRGNIHGVICFDFILYWFFLSVLYYLLLHEKIFHLAVKFQENYKILKVFLYILPIFTIDVCITIRKILKKVTKFSKNT